jgi:hypothetical protein
MISNVADSLPKEPIVAMEQPQPHPRPQRWSADPLDPRRCAVLVPFATHISPPCQCALEELERRGYHVRRVGGYAQIGEKRCQEPFC